MQVRKHMLTSLDTVVDINEENYHKPKETHYNRDRDTHVIRPSNVSTRDHVRIRKQVLKEEGYLDE